MLLNEVVTTSRLVAATSGRSGKVAAIADLLRRLDDSEMSPATALVAGEPAGVAAATVRRAVRLSGDLPGVARIALTGGAAGLAAVGGLGVADDERPERFQDTMRKVRRYRPDKSPDQADDIAAVRAVPGGEPGPG